MLTPESIIFIGQSSTAATSLPTITTTSNTTNNLTSSSSLPLMTSTIPTTLKPMMPSSNHMVGSTIIPITNSSVEPRLRWVDFHHRHQQHQAYPPRVPSIPGIPSGFRNTIATIVSTTTTTTTMSPNDASTIGPMYSAGAHHPFFSGTNLNPIGFGGAVIMDDVEQPFKTPNPNRRYNITRVELVNITMDKDLTLSNLVFTSQSITCHLWICSSDDITAECSDEYMKVVVRFNGTFTGLIYSSGYVHDPNCIYVNGSGRSYYEFFIRLNQCGTLGRQEMFHPTQPGEARRRDQLMWNTLSIQYNAMIEEEFDEHFRLTCEYGSDFWKTVTFPSVNVEINTGSPIVFTINPPQCQMEIRRGFGIAGSRTSGPVTVGDPLTLLINMKSEKAGFDILVKNCVAHNGAQQRMQLIDSNGCVTNDKLISPFRGTYNTENGNQVSLYSYLKAFRFTGSPALYLECDIHMCHNRCPPQRCYWRNLAKRSIDYNETFNNNETSKPIVSESISLFQALEVYHEQDDDKTNKSPKSSKSLASGHGDDLICLRSGGLTMIMGAFASLMIVSIATSICYCQRMRRLNHFQRNIIHCSERSRPTFGSEYSIAHSVLSSSSDCHSALTGKNRHHFYVGIKP
ncbi:hypothetical protein BLOT_001629 [Blomia tropicalis]|nr:hypothetical protein BLOT_001629 [Blomia tropicalis]